MKKLLVILAVVLIASVSFAEEAKTEAAPSPWALFGGLSGAGMMNGGLRYTLNDNVCFDASLAASLDSDTDVYSFIDCYFYKLAWGAGVGIEKMANADVEVDVFAAYALEKPVSDGVSLGISPTLISKRVTEEGPVELLPNWLVYVAINF